MESVGPGTITTSNGGGRAKAANLSTQKKNGLNKIHSTFKFTPSTLKLKIALSTLILSTCVGHYNPNCTRVLGGLVSGPSKSVSPSKYVYFSF